MLKGLVITPPVVGRISIGRVVERNGKRLPEKDDQFTLTSQIQNRDGWILHPLDEAARRGFANGAFEELEEDVPALVEEFYPDAEQGEPGRAQPAPQPALRARLQEKVARLGTG